MTEDNTLIVFDPIKNRLIAKHKLNKKLSISMTINRNYMMILSQEEC